MSKQLQLKDASIYNQDCFVAFKDLDDNSVDLVATDPPYFLDGMDDGWSDKTLNQKKSRAETVGGLPVGMKFDPSQGKRLQQFFYKFSEEAQRVLKPGGFMVSFSQGRLYHRIAVAAEDAGFEIRDMLVWEHNGGQGKAFKQDHFVKRMKLSEGEKQELIQNMQGRKTPQLRPKFEPIVVAQKPRQGTFVDNWAKWQTGLVQVDFGPGQQQSTVLNYPKPRKEKFIDHMTVKPVDLMARLIEIFSIRGQVVLDPFLGSGSTGVAALRLGRKFIGFEIEPKYFNIASERLKNYGKATQVGQSHLYVARRNPAVVRNS